MDIIITYDISEGHPVDKHSEIKKEMEDRGYYDSYTRGNPPVYYDLLNTTLWKQDSAGILTTQTGLNDLNSSVNAVNVKFKLSPPMKVIKAECIAFTQHSGIPRS